MGRPIGSPNRERPFKEALRMALRERPHALRRIAHTWLDRAEEGDLSYGLAVADRLDGRPVQAIDRHDVLITELSDQELLLIASSGRNEVTDAELHLIAAGGRIEDDMKVIPPMPSKD
jgi:hypothetical protein